MNTYTNTMHPEKKIQRTTRDNLFSNIAIMTVILTLVTAAAIAVSIANRPVAAAENNLAVPYSNVLELQYAQPWLDVQNKPTVSFGNALELQYAQPWLEAQQQILLNCHRSLDMLYACQYGHP